MKLSLVKIGAKIAITAALVFGCAGLFGAPVDAAPLDGVCEGVGYATGEDCNETEVTMQKVWGMAGTVINWILIAAGIIAVGFIIWAGIRYVLSGGDAEKVKKAKNTLLYAIIGLLIAALAMIIVNLVLGASTQVVNSD